MLVVAGREAIQGSFLECEGFFHARESAFFLQLKLLQELEGRGNFEDIQHVFGFFHFGRTDDHFVLISHHQTPKCFVDPVRPPAVAVLRTVFPTTTGRGPSWSL